MKITSQTTLGELQIELAKRGVTHFTARPTHSQRYFCGMQTGDAQFHIGFGDSLPEAIGDAFDKLVLSIGESFKEPASKDTPQ